MARTFRGSGLRHTLPYVVRFAGLWLVVTIAAIVVASVSSFWLFAERVGEGGAAQLRTVIVVQATLSILAVIALAVFTTHRLAGPWIAVRRALDRVRDGDLDGGLRLRATDPRIKEVELAFAQMLDSLRQRYRAAAPLVADPLPGAARPVSPP
jgi:nitrate/nitrite-specific signal transduction histidine kinase